MVEDKSGRIVASPHRKPQQAHAIDRPLSSFVEGFGELPERRI